MDDDAHQETHHARTVMVCVLQLGRMGIVEARGMCRSRLGFAAMFKAWVLVRLMSRSDVCLDSQIGNQTRLRDFRGILVTAYEQISSIISLCK
jgi:hypothetical protein